MATFIELRTDKFKEVLKNKSHSLTEYGGVRRPLRGIEIKNDTYATIKVMTDDGTELPLVDSGARELNSSRKIGSSATTKLWSNFIIQGIEDARQEKIQIMETFGDAYVFFFGERPRILSVSGLLLNTLDFNWRSEFWFNYENLLRGTKLVQQNARVYLHWDDIVVEGYLMSATAQDNADMPYHIPFQFTLFVTNQTFLSNIGDPMYPPHKTVNINTQGLMIKEPSIWAKTNAAQRIEEGIGNLKRINNVLGYPVVAAGAAAGWQVITGGGLPRSVTSLGPSKTILKNALQYALVAQSITFLGAVQKYFNQRVVAFPMGPPKSGRSMIRDNTDEYVDMDPQPFMFDYAAINDTMARQARSKNILDAIGKATRAMDALGVTPVFTAGLKNIGAHQNMLLVGAGVASLASFSTMAIP